MIVYGCGRGRIHRNLQTPYDPGNVKPTRYGRNKRETRPPKPEPSVVVTDVETGESRVFSGPAQAAIAIGCSKGTVGDRLAGRVKRPVKGRYLVTRKK